MRAARLGKKVGNASAAQIAPSRATSMEVTMVDRFSFLIVYGFQNMVSELVVGFCLPVMLLLDYHIGDPFGKCVLTCEVSNFSVLFILYRNV